MIKTKFLATAGKAGIVLNAVILLTVTGCGNNTAAPAPAVPPPPSAAVQAPPTVVVEAPAPGVVEQDDYVYYPNYGIYYSSNRHQYASLEGGAWVSQAAPRGVGVDELRASPSVKMDFHDAPANHHAEIARQYPKDWKPPGSR